MLRTQINPLPIPISNAHKAPAKQVDKFICAQLAPLASAKSLICVSLKHQYQANIRPLFAAKDKKIIWA